jgi:1,2-phenylacetyl-CoA epoxidase catalytic subunit
MKRRLEFNVPTIINDTKEARIKAEAAFKEIVRAAVSYFGPEKVKRLVSELTTGRGNKPDEVRNEKILSEYDAEKAAAKGKVNHKKFAEDFCKRHHQQSADAVLKQLGRLRNGRRRAKEKEAHRERQFRKLVSKRGKTILGTE